MGRITFHTRLDENVYARVKEESERTSISMNQLINAILTERLVDEIYTMSIRVMRSGDSTTYEIYIPERMSDQLSRG